MKIKIPAVMKKLCTHRRKLSEEISTMVFREKLENGKMYLVQLFPGVYISFNDFYMEKIPADQRNEEYNYLKINYCFEGRCEVNIGNERYVYVSEGDLSIDINQSQNAVYSPGSRYSGIEFFLDLQVLEKEYPIAFEAFHIDISQLCTNYCTSQGSFIEKASDIWKQKANEIREILGGVEHGILPRIDKVRILSCELLDLLEGKEATSGDAITSFLTLGQREIVKSFQQKIVENISKRYTIEEYAKSYGISASSLKKYFMQIYGKNVTSYMKDYRMETAKRLLEETTYQIVEIAAQVGYENQSKFSAVFKSYIGTKPIEYRRLQIIKKGGKE